MSCQPSTFLAVDAVSRFHSRSALSKSTQSPHVSWCLKLIHRTRTLTLTERALAATTATGIFRSSCKAVALNRQLGHTEDAVRGSYHTEATAPGTFVYPHPFPGRIDNDHIRRKHVRILCVRLSFSYELQEETLTPHIFSTTKEAVLVNTV